MNLRLEQSQAVVINIINRHCYKRSDAILNGQPRTARSTQTSCGELREFIFLEGYREGIGKGKGEIGEENQTNEDGREGKTLLHVVAGSRLISNRHISI